jgi:hypothetical protein
MANDADDCITEDFHVGAKEKVKQLWQGQLGSTVVNDTTTSDMENVKDSTETLNTGEGLQRSDDQNKIQESSAPTIKKSYSADKIESRKKGRSSRRSPP